LLRRHRLLWRRLHDHARAGALDVRSLAAHFQGRWTMDDDARFLGVV
jgi:hypothetical protein